MSRKFDPVRERSALLKHYLPIMPAFAPDSVRVTALPGYVQFMISSITQLYWFGLGDRARRALVGVLDWMDSSGPPSPDHWPQDKYHYREAPTAHFHWWESVGLGRWLLGREGVDAAFAFAVQVEWDGWRQATPTEQEQDRGNRQNILSERLAVALCAGLPDYAARFCEATQLRQPFLSVKPMWEFGQWASTYLVQGQARDETFVGKGQGALRKTLLEYYEPSSAWVEATLWLKAIYFDGGVTRTAQETIFRAYDCMPGIPRPDFVNPAAGD